MVRLLVIKFFSKILTYDLIFGFSLREAFSIHTCNSPRPQNCDLYFKQARPAEGRIKIMSPSTFQGIPRRRKGAGPAGDTRTQRPGPAGGTPAPPAQAGRLRRGLRTGEQWPEGSCIYSIAAQAQPRPGRKPPPPAGGGKGRGVFSGGCGLRPSASSLVSRDSVSWGISYVCFPRHRLTRSCLHRQSRDLGPLGRSRHLGPVRGPGSHETLSPASRPPCLRALGFGLLSAPCGVQRSSRTSWLSQAHGFQ